MKRIKGISVSDLIIGLVIAAIIIVVISTIVSAVKNEANYINEGIVIDKHYRAEYTSYTNSGKVLIPHTEPERYTLTIQGEKNGETVEYSFTVPKEEYFKYNIGDYYKK